MGRGLLVTLSRGSTTPSLSPCCATTSKWSCLRNGSPSPSRADCAALHQEPRSDELLTQANEFLLIWSNGLFFSSPPLFAEGNLLLHDPGMFFDIKYYFHY